MNATHDPRASDDPLDVAAIVAHCAHVLPAQRPLDAFVHHNTLHAFEHLPFEEAVETAGRLFDAVPYPFEASFREDWKRGRVHTRDLDAVLELRVPDRPLGFGAPGLTLRDAVRALMLGLQSTDGGHSLQWRLTESPELTVLPAQLPRSALERLSDAGPAEAVQRSLWAACAAQCPRVETTAQAVRPRDWLYETQGLDPDTLVHPALIRWCGAFLDGGHSYWPMAQRERGFFAATLHYLAAPGPVAHRWMRPLKARARGLIAAQTTAANCITATATRMGVPLTQLEALIEQSLLAMAGWPGMFVQLKARPDLAPAPMPPTELVDYVAVRLLFDEAAARSMSTQAKGPLLPPDAEYTRVYHKDPAWTVFSAARLLGVLPDEAQQDPTVLEGVQGLLAEYPNVRRRALWLLAYERRYRAQICDAVLAHAPRVAPLRLPEPRAQIITCIDDREESLRRHLEEIDGAYETLGVAGFYGVAMYYRNLGNPHQTPLCPANVVPTHMVKEVAVDATEWAKTSETLARKGRRLERFSVGQNTLLRGGFIALTGWSSIVPMAARLLAPSAHAKFVGRRNPKVPTRLALEASTPPTFDHGLQVGYTVDEMIAIVRRYLEDMGLVEGFAPLVVVLGHGSKSMNNPHEAAHDCGACGGGRGGPNARAYAAMANRPDVRAALAQAGIVIPDGTWFIGGYHNTADDEIEYYDLDLVPQSQQTRLVRTQLDLDEARRRDAHERCRRFVSAPLSLTPTQALRHVENRAEDLAQPRPEYGHCTNALCIIGQRQWNRGLFLDRRVFLQSYDPKTDPDTAILERILAMVGPVGAGISLEYYFSFVDPNRYGSNTKLPHNITGLLGVMNGPSSDLKTGLPWQMVEIHEPMRLLNIIEARPEQLEAILARQPALRRLVVNRWILVVAYDPTTNEMWFFEETGFVPYVPEVTALPSVETSAQWYGGRREHLMPCSVTAGFAEVAP
jgi:hypothetical protein